MIKTNPSNPFTSLVLDTEEKILETAFENGEYEESLDLSDTKKMIKEAASNYLELNTARPITIRINQFDLIKVKARAKRKQIPYQTLLGTLIHEYAEGEKTLII